MEEQLWHIDYQTKALQDFRARIQSLWNDEASREINMRYLNPHEDDSLKIVVSFKSQYQKLQDTEQKLFSATEHAATIEQLSSEFAQLIDYVDEDIHIAQQLGEQYKSQIANANALVSDIQKLIAEAKANCEGVANE